MKIWSALLQQHIREVMCEQVECFASVLSQHMVQSARLISSQGLLCQDTTRAKLPDPNTFTQDVALMAAVSFRPALDDAFVVGHRSHKRSDGR